MILEFKGSVQEMSGCPRLESRLGTTIDESLRYLNDNGYEGIYQPIADEIMDGKINCYDAGTGVQIGINDQIKEKAVMVPKLAGGNGGGGPVFNLLNSTNYGNTAFIFGFEAIPVTTGYTNFPSSGGRNWRWARWNGAAWETVWTSNSGGNYPGYVTMGRVGFTVQGSSLSEFRIYESIDTGAGGIAPQLVDYGTNPTDYATDYTGVVYNGTGRISDLAVVQQ
jgi:hypothetical protein